MVELPIYLDNNASTRVDPRVLEQMLPYFTTHFGNPSSRNHSFGWKAEEAVDQAREQVAALLGASPREIVFTSGATESNNLAIKGVAEKYRDKGRHIVTCATEHKAVLDPCKGLERHGFDVTVLPVDEFGRVEPEVVAASLRDDTILVSIMLANNELGTIQPLEAIGRICRERGVFLHSDATQAVGKIPVDVESLHVDLLSLTAHKFYGPKGVGALYIRSKNPRVRLEPLFEGGSQERGMRSGTLAVPNIVGLGATCALAQSLLPTESVRIAGLRDRLEAGITHQVSDLHPNTHPTEHLPGTFNVSFAGVEGEALMMAMKDIAVSSGSACNSGSGEPSYVLRAIGLADELAHASLRFSVGRFNNEDEIDYTIQQVARYVAELRNLNSMYLASTGRN